MNKHINSNDTEKGSMYYPFSLEIGHSIHLEHTHENKVNVWESKMVKEGLTRDEAIEFSHQLIKEKNNE